MQSQNTNSTQASNGQQDQRTTATLGKKDNEEQNIKRGEQSDSALQTENEPKFSPILQSSKDIETATSSDTTKPIFESKNLRNAQGEDVSEHEEQKSITNNLFGQGAIPLFSGQPLSSGLFSKMMIPPKGFSFMSNQPNNSVNDLNNQNTEKIVPEVPTGGQLADRTKDPQGLPLQPQIQSSIPLKVPLTKDKGKIAIAPFTGLMNQQTFVSGLNTNQFGGLLADSLFSRNMGTSSSGIAKSLQTQSTVVKPSSGGELVPGTNYSYHSLDLMAPILPLDQNLSLDQVESSKAKLFILGSGASEEGGRTVMLFLSCKNNISVLLDQQELCENVISQTAQQELALDDILDFTLVRFSLLVVLYRMGQLVVFDCQHLFAIHGQSSPVRYLHKAELVDSECFRVDSVEMTQNTHFQNNGEYQVVLSGKDRLQTATINRYECENQQPFESGQDLGDIVDICISNDKVVVCYQPKQKGCNVVVNDLQSGKIMFKAFYADCDQVQNMQFVPETCESAINAQEVVASGYLILTELKKTKYLKKVHIVQMVQKQKSKKRTDRLEQIDALTFSEDSAKLVEFVEHQGSWYVFMLNSGSLSKSENKLRVFSVKITPKQPNEEEGQNENCECPLSFVYVSEAMIPVQSLQQSERNKPAFLRVLQKQGAFYVYVGMGSQTVVFKREVLQVSGTESVTSSVLQKRQFKPLITKETKLSTIEPEEIIKKMDDDFIKETMELNKQIDNIAEQAMKEIETPRSNNTLCNDDAIISIQDPAIQNVQSKQKKQTPSNTLAKHADKDKNLQKKQKTQSPTQTPTSNMQPKQQPLTIQQQQKQDKQQNPMQVAVKQKVAASVTPNSRKAQQEMIIENYAELNRKYAELHMKMNQLQQSVQAQKDLQVQVEITITKAVRSALPELVKEQIKETIPPLIHAQSQLLDQKVCQVIIPKLEQKLSEAGGEISRENVRKIIQQEFREAMTKEIVPELEKIIKSMLSQIKEPLTNVNNALFEKLQYEEKRSDQMIQNMQLKLNQVVVQQQMPQQQQHIRVQTMPQQIYQQPFYQQQPVFQQQQSQQQQPLYQHQNQVWQLQHQNSSQSLGPNNIQLVQSQLENHQSPQTFPQMQLQPTFQPFTPQQQVQQHITSVQPQQVSFLPASQQQTSAFNPINTSNQNMINSHQVNNSYQVGGRPISQRNSQTRQNQFNEMQFPQQNQFYGNMTDGIDQMMVQQQQKGIELYVKTDSPEFKPTPQPQQMMIAQPQQQQIAQQNMMLNQSMQQQQQLNMSQQMVRSQNQQKQQQIINVGQQMPINKFGTQSIVSPIQHSGNLDEQQQWLNQSQVQMQFFQSDQQ